MIFFSDCVVWSYPIEKLPTTYDESIEFICLGMFDLLARVFSKGIAIRGAVSIGNIFKENDKIFGDGLINAYRLEGKAKFPRIVFDKRIVDRLRPGELETTFDGALIYEKESDLYDFNYFDVANSLLNESIILPQRRNIVLEFIDPAKRIIEQGLQHSNQEVRSKYEWLKAEYDKYTLPPGIQRAITKWSSQKP